MRTNSSPARHRVVVIGIAAAAVAVASIGIGAVAASAHPAGVHSVAAHHSATTPTPTPTSPSSAHTATATRAPSTRPATSSPTPAHTAAPLAFTRPSSATEPILLTARSGVPFAYRFHTNATGTVAFAMDEGPGLTNDSPRASDHFVVTSDTGVLSGTGVETGTWDFSVVALSGGAEAHASVRLTVLPGAPVGVRTFVTPVGTTSPTWEVLPGGVVQERTSPTAAARRVSSVVVPAGEQLSVSGVAVDAAGNVLRAPDAGGAAATVTSSVRADRVVVGANGSVVVTVSSAPSHRLTVTQEGGHTTFTVTVR
jgi:hypothetical protein